MRRLEQRRIEAALSHLNPSAGPEVSSIEDLVRELEAVATATGEREERSEEAATRFSAALDVLAEAVIVCDEHGDEIYRNVAASAYARGRLGDVLADQAVRDALAEAAGGECAERTLELFSPVRRNLLIRAYPISIAGRPIGVVAIVEDVSERRRLDSIRRDFVANVSHELKTPVGALSLLAETLDGEDDPEVVARLAARVGAEAGRLGRIIDDLLDLSRIEAAEEGPRASIGVDGLVREAVEPLRPVAAAAGIGLRIDPAPAHLRVPGDRRDLMSALGNLVDNAVKYSEPGSEVTVTVDADVERVRLAVSDRGIGIPARDLGRIFERFYRVDRARSRLTGGTGLGLAIVRHVAVNHGGDIEVVSREGEGSTFTLVLPLAARGVAEEAGRG